MSKKKATVDIFDIDPVGACEAGTDVELVHPATKKPLGTFLRVIGAESKELTNLARRKAKESTIKSLTAKKGDDIVPEDAAEEIVETVFNKANTIETAVTATVGWWRFADIEKREGRIDTITFNGEELAFSKDAANKVFTERPWIAVQADQGAGNLARFMEG